MLSRATAPAASQASLTTQRLPSPLSLLLFGIAAVLVGIAFAKGLVDSDMHWHLTTGRLIVESGRVPTADPFSFTWGGMPWTLHEWLSEVAMFGLVQVIGTLGALVVFGLVAAASIAVLGFMLTRQGVRVLAFALPAVLALAVMTPYVTVRPQVVSWLFLAIVIWVLSELRPDRPARVMLLVPIFILWANLHGVYVVGLGVVATYLLFTFLGRTPMAPAWRWTLAAFVGCLLASMITPAGPIGILYPLRYIEGGDWGLAHIQEWESPNFHLVAHSPLLILIVALGLNQSRGTPGWLVMLSWVGVVMALMAMRNAPIAAVFAVPSLALGLEARLREREAARPPRRQPSESVAVSRRLMEITAALAIAVGSLAVLVPPVLGEGMDRLVAAKFPVAGADRLVELQPDARVLADYGWGGYMISRLYPTGGRVFVDGRNDMYDQQILEDYDAVVNADPGWEAITDRYGVEAILLRPTAALTRGPAEAAGWCEAFRDEVQVLYLRSCEG